MKAKNSVLYKENYESKKLGITLSKAYAYITDFKMRETNGETYGRAIFSIQTSRENCVEKAPIEEVILESVKLDRTKNVLTQVYEKMKEGSTEEVINPETGKKEIVKSGMPFYEWEDDIVVGQSTKSNTVSAILGTHSF